MTAHGALDKACFYFDIELRKVHLQSDSTLDIKEMRKQIDSNTVSLMVSFPDYAFGNFDPIPVIAAIA